MNTEQYLAERLADTKKVLEEYVEQVRQGLNDEMNAFLTREIAEATQNLNDATEQCQASFLRDMKAVESFPSIPGMKSARDTLENDAKHRFEKSLEFNTTLWTKFIDECRAQMCR